MKLSIPASFLICLVLATGCAQYEPVRAENPVRIALAPVINESELAQISAPISRNVRESLAHSQAYNLVGEDQAEVVIHIRILGLNRKALARDPQDTGRPLSYRETVRVAIRWESDLPAPWGLDPVTRVESEILLYAQPELVTAETSAMPALVDGLTKKIMARLIWPVSITDK